MSDDKTPMERFEDLARKVFSVRKEDLKRPKEAEADAEEVMEGGIPPTDGEGDE
jgi:hypothetical protein